PLPWHTEDTLVAALEMLLAWTSPVAAAPEATVAWLAPMLAQPGPHTDAALRRLCRPGALPEASQTTLHAALVTLLTSPTYGALADQAAALLGGSALLDRIAVLLRQLDQHVAPAPSHVSQRRKQRHQNRRASSRGPCASDVSRVLCLIGLLAQAHATTGTPNLSEMIRDWLIHYPSLSMRAPEVVGALLGLLRQCPDAHAAI